jgi:hypothetical protein
VPNVRLERALGVPAESAAQALGELLKAIADQEGMWHGFALHVSLGELRLPDVGYVAVPIQLEVTPQEARTFEIAFHAASLPVAFPGFKGRMGLDSAPGIGESMLYLFGDYDLPLHVFGKLLDAALLPRVAERSLQNFIEDIAQACEARVNKREAEFARYHFYSRTVQ